MSTRRVYASWLPPNPRERMQLIKLRRMQRFVIAWMLSLIPGIWIAALLAPVKAFIPLTLLWIAAGLWFAELVGAIRCPRCGCDFCGKREVVCWHGLFARRCEHCGLTLKRTVE
jgi:hypothetical protein